MSTTPKISIIMPAHNREGFIAESIQSALDQSFIDFELIIIDDASKDKTLEVARSFKDPRIKIIQNEKNLGISKTRNKAISLACGEYIAPLDSDDLWIDKDKLKKQVEFLNSHMDHVLVGSNMIKIDSTGKEVEKISYPLSDAEIREKILIRNPFTQSTLLYRREIAIECGGYNASYTIGEDYELWLRMGLTAKLANMPDLTTGYRVHGGNITRTKRLTGARETLEIVRLYSDKYPCSTRGIIWAYLRILVMYAGIR